MLIGRNHYSVMLSAVYDWSSCKRHNRFRWTLIATMQPLLLVLVFNQQSHRYNKYVIIIMTYTYHFVIYDSFHASFSQRC